MIPFSHSTNTTAAAFFMPSLSLCTRPDSRSVEQGVKAVATISCITCDTGLVVHYCCTLVKRVSGTCPVGGGFLRGTLCSCAR